MSIQVELASLVLLIPALACAQAVFPDAIRQKDVMVAARDGVELATDVYRPGSLGVPSMPKLPVLLHRTPYNKNAADAVNPNTGEPLGQDRRAIKADQTINHSQQFPSHVVLYGMPSK
jgi:X-Pro dipeptidyl-peptidase (S15 family)